LDEWTDGGRLGCWCLGGMGATAGEPDGLGAEVSRGWSPTGFEPPVAPEHEANSQSQRKRREPWVRQPERPAIVNDHSRFSSV